MTTITTDRAGLEELLGEYWEIAFEESGGVTPTGNKANRVLHEIRALFDVKQAEIARLKTESEERLQNCAALVAENERLRAAPATAPAQPERKPPQQDASLSATTKALTFARTALLVVNSGASQKAIALIDDALNQAPVQAQVLNPLTDGEKIYALWHSSDANDLDDFLDGWRHAEAFHGITGDKQ